jgi:hypothetical protein
VPSDDESRNANPPRVEVSASAPKAGRVARPLGRGLEDVSHFFLSQTPGVRTRELTDDRTLERAPARPGTRSAAVLLRPGQPLTGDQLTAVLKECPGALENNMQVIDARIPCSPCGEIDLLAVDRANQLTIIDVETTCGDGLLLSGVSHVDWVVRNVANMRRMYQGCRIDFSRQPRLFLIAPRFSPFLRSAIRQITRPDITCLKYHGVEVSDGTGIFFEHVGGDGE